MWILGDQRPDQPLRGDGTTSGGVPLDESRYDPSRQGTSNPILGDEGRPESRTTLFLLSEQHR